MRWLHVPEGGADTICPGCFVYRPKVSAVPLAGQGAKRSEMHRSSGTAFPLAMSPRQPCPLRKYETTQLPKQCEIWIAATISSKRAHCRHKKQKKDRTRPVYETARLAGWLAGAREHDEKKNWEVGGLEFVQWRWTTKARNSRPLTNGHERAAGSDGGRRVVESARDTPFHQRPARSGSSTVTELV